MSSLVLWMSGGCLLLALGVSLLTSKDEVLPDRPKLASEMPKRLAGWDGQDLPLGNTEVLNATEKLLNYDDYIYRVYRRDGIEVFLYAMYWKQGSISVREIAGHTPDGCWVANGAMLFGPMQARALTVMGKSTVTAEVREFRFPGGPKVQVAWWHLWGNNLVDRGFDQKSLTPLLRELWTWLGQRHGMRCDQALVRIHVSGDLGAAMRSEPVQAFLAMFPEVFNARPLNQP